MPSATYYPETKYKTRLSRACGTADTTLYVDALPNLSTGFLMIEKDSTDNYEIILYAGTAGAGTTADPYRLTTVTRGLSVTGTSLTAGTGKAHGRVEIGCADVHFFEALLKLHIDSTQVMPMVATTASLPTTGNTQYDVRFVKDQAAFYYWTLVATSGSTSDWNVIQTAAISNATEAVAGKVELGTPTDNLNKTATGDSGGPLAAQPKYSVKIHDVYTPAYLTGGSSATSVVATWNAVTDGSFSITIDGVVRNVTGINFSVGVTTMELVASTIQTALRAVTSSTETVVWSTDHFVITSANTTSSSAITVTSATGGGTDISGAGGTAFMDAETGRGTATAAAINKIPYAGYQVVLNASGELDDNFISSTLYANMLKRSEVDAKGDLLAGTADNTISRLAVGTNGQYLKANSATATGLEWGSVDNFTKFVHAGEAIYLTAVQSVLSPGAGYVGGTIQMASGATNSIAFPCEVPRGATSISSIKLVWAGGGAGNTRITTQRASFISSAGVVQQDENGADRTDALAAPGPTLLTIATDVYNGITISEGGILTIAFQRAGADGADTAGDAYVIGMLFTFA